MKRSFLGKAAFRIGVGNWISFVIFAIIFTITMNNDLGAKLPEWMQTTIILFFLLTLFSGFSALMGVLLTIVDFRRLDNNKRNLLINLTLNLSYFVIYVLLLNSIFDALMSV